MTANCSDLLQFDTTVIQNDLASQLSFLSYVSEENYDEMKRSYSASIPDFFTGKYDQFEKKRSEMTKVLSLSQVTKVHQSYYQHALSAGGAAAFASCVAEQSRKLISAWVEKTTADSIVVVVKTGVLGHEDVEFKTSPIQPRERPRTLAAGGSQALTFAYDPRRDFVLTINAESRRAMAQDQAVISVPRTRKLRLTKPQKPVTTSITCGAGGQGSTSGNRIFTDGALFADEDYYLLPETVRELSREPVWSGGGLRYFTLVQTQTVVDGKVKRIDLHPTDIDGTSGDTQSNVRITYQATVERILVVEE